MQTDKKQKPTQNNPWLTRLVTGLVFLSITVFAVSKLIEVKGKAIAEQAIAEYEAQHPSPKIVAVNQEKLFDELSGQSDDQVRVLKAINLLTQMMESDGYIVIDSSAVMMLPEQYQLPIYSVQDIEMMANERGVTIDEETEKLIKQARDEAKKALAELEAQSDKLLEQFKQYQ